MLKIPKVADQSELIRDNCTDRINMVNLELSAEDNPLWKSSWIVRTQLKITSNQDKLSPYFNNFYWLIYKIYFEFKVFECHSFTRLY